VSIVWEPWDHLREVHPDVRVVEMDLAGRLQGCVDVEQRIIWLATGLDGVARRCTLAYEIAQLEQGPVPSDPCMAQAHQRAAQDWSSLMLISSEEFVAAWASCLSLAAMAERCGVDLPTFRNRIRAASNAEQDAAVAAIAETRLTA
jgi:hypothetical protein